MVEACRAGAFAACSGSSDPRAGAPFLRLQGGGEADGWKAPPAPPIRAPEGPPTALGVLLGSGRVVLGLACRFERPLASVGGG